MSIGCDILQIYEEDAKSLRRFSAVCNAEQFGRNVYSPITYQRVAASGNRNMMEEEANSAKVLCTCVRGKRLKLLLT